MQILLVLFEFFGYVYFNVLKCENLVLIPQFIFISPVDPLNIVYDGCPPKFKLFLGSPKSLPKVFAFRRIVSIQIHYLEFIFEIKQQDVKVILQYRIHNLFTLLHFKQINPILNNTRLL